MTLFYLIYENKSKKSQLKNKSLNITNNMSIRLSIFSIIVIQYNIIYIYQVIGNLIIINILKIILIIQLCYQ